MLTVGYGDIKATTTEELVFACIWMLLGVMVYSFTIGSVSSIFAYKSAQKENEMQLINILSKLRTEYKLPYPLYLKAKKAVRTGFKDEEDSDFSGLLGVLPASLKNELGFLINKKKLMGIAFFDNKPKEFIAAVGPVMKKVVMNIGDMIYSEGDPVNDVFFIKSGKVAAVLKECINFKYLKYGQGQSFGHVDVICGHEYRKETMKVTAPTEILQCNKKEFEKIFCQIYQSITADFLDDGRMQKNLLKNVHKEAKDYYKTEYNQKKN